MVMLVGMKMNNLVLGLMKKIQQLTHCLPLLENIFNELQKNVIKILENGSMILSQDLVLIQFIITHI